MPDRQTSAIAVQLGFVKKRGLVFMSRIDCLLRRMPRQCGGHPIGRRTSHPDRAGLTVTSIRTASNSISEGLRLGRVRLLPLRSVNKAGDRPTESCGKIRMHCWRNKSAVGTKVFWPIPCSPCRFARRGERICWSTGPTTESGRHPS